jgi:glyoxylase I family protein
MSAARSEDRPATARNSVPQRLHHSAYVCRDLEETRKFYEDVLGWPLAAVWREHDIVFDHDLTYCHVFFELGDGSLLAFFKFSEPQHQERFAQYGPHSPFLHLALKADQSSQGQIKSRLEAAGYKTNTINHGYLRFALCNRSEWAEPGVHG